MWHTRVRPRGFDVEVEWLCGGTDIPTPKAGESIVTGDLRKQTLEIYGT